MWRGVARYGVCVGLKVLTCEFLIFIIRDCMGFVKGWNCMGFVKGWRGNFSQNRVKKWNIFEKVKDFLRFREEWMKCLGKSGESFQFEREWEWWSWEVREVIRGYEGAEKKKLRIYAVLIDMGKIEKLYRIGIFWDRCSIFIYLERDGMGWCEWEKCVDREFGDSVKMFQLWMFYRV